MWGVWAFYQADAFDAIVRAHGTLTGYAALYAAGTILRLSALTFAAALRGGEVALYAEIAAGGRLRLAKGLRFLTPKRAFRLLDVYVRVYTLRLLWLLYFFIPADRPAVDTARECVIFKLNRLICARADRAR